MKGLLFYLRFKTLIFSRVLSLFCNDFDMFISLSLLSWQEKMISSIFSLFPEVSVIFPHFFLHFLCQFGLPGLTHLGRPWLYITANLVPR